MTPGDTIRQARKAANLTQRQLAGKIDVEPSLLSKWETGHHEPRPAVLAKIEDALGLPRGQLLIEAGMVERPSSSTAHSTDDRVARLSPERQRIARRTIDSLLDELEAEK